MVPEQDIFMVSDSLLRYINLFDTLHNEASYRLHEGSVKELLSTECYNTFFYHIVFYFVSAIIVFVFGAIDEAIQWLLPNRVFDTCPNSSGAGKRLNNEWKRRYFVAVIDSDGDK